MQDKKQITIAIDGYSSCGKSTVARDLARRLNITYIDSGAMYRAVTLAGMEAGLIKGREMDTKGLVKLLESLIIDFRMDENNKQAIFLNGVNIEEKIRDMEVSRLVSPVSQIREVREKLVDLQRRMSQDISVAMDGRDIGTVVFPHADVKVFMTARQRVRAERRYKEMLEKGVNTRLEEVMENISQRDYLDSNRKISPLQKADDALVLDNSDMSQEEQLEWIVELIREKTGFHG